MTEYKFLSMFKYSQYGVIDIDSNLKIKNISVTNHLRRELVDADAPTLNAFSGSEIDGLILDNVTAENFTRTSKMQLLRNEATVMRAHYSRLYQDGVAVEL